MKICKDCNKSLPTDKFYLGHARCKDCFLTFKRDNYAKINPDMKIIHRISNIDIKNKAAECAVCGPVKVINRNGKKPLWICYIKHSERARNYSLKKKYSISSNEFDSMLRKQDNCCALCKRKSNKYVVDHDHKCCPGKVTCGNCIRQIICSPCNFMLGYIETWNIELSTIESYLAQ